MYVTLAERKAALAAWAISCVPVRLAVADFFFVSGFALEAIGSDQAS
jgi:hypothetical protein